MYPCKSSWLIAVHNELFVFLHLCKICSTVIFQKRLDHTASQTLVRFCSSFVPTNCNRLYRFSNLLCLQCLHLVWLLNWLNGLLLSHMNKFNHLFLIVLGYSANCNQALSLIPYFTMHFVSELSCCDYCALYPSPEQ
jgi:hypothetical protein